MLDTKFIANIFLLLEKFRRMSGPLLLNTYSVIFNSQFRDKWIRTNRRSRGSFSLGIQRSFRCCRQCVGFWPFESGQSSPGLITPGGRRSSRMNCNQAKSHTNSPNPFQILHKGPVRYCSNPKIQHVVDRYSETILNCPKSLPAGRMK